MGWISADNPPKEKQRVIVRCKTVGTTAGAFLWGKWITDLGSEHSEVTHWMPLPNPPGEMTNGDRIRAMIDEELSYFLCDFRTGSAGEHHCAGCKAEEYCRTGHNGMIEWLQQPAKED